MYYRHLLGRYREGSPKRGIDFGSPARKKQPCCDVRHQDLGSAAFNHTLSTLSESSSVGFPEIDYSPCPLRATQSLVALRQRMTDTFPLLSQGISLDNPLYYALNQSPTPSPVDLVNKEIPTTSKKYSSETPTHARDVAFKFAKALNLGLNESDEVKLSPKRESLSLADKPISFWFPKEKPKTCEVSPLARRLAWLRLNNVEKNCSQNKSVDASNCEKNVSNDKKYKESLAQANHPLLHKPFTSSTSSMQIDHCDDVVNRRDDLRHRLGNIVVDSSVINILNTNHDRHNPLDILDNNFISNSCDNPKSKDDQMESENACEVDKPKSNVPTNLKRRGVVFNEQTFLLNTPPASDDSDERQTKSSFTASIDLDEPSTLQRQKAIRRRLRSVSDDNLPMTKRFAKKHPISYLTLPTGLPSPFEETLTPVSTKSKSVSNLCSTSNRKVTFGSLYDIEYSDSGGVASPSFLGLTLPKGIPSPPSPEEEEILGVRPLLSPKATQPGVKRKIESVVNSSECSEETWDSHRLQCLKTPRLDNNAYEDCSLSDSLKMKSPASSKNNDEEDNDDDFSSLGECFCFQR